MKYMPLLDLNIVHSYYTDNRCPDFALVPTPATQRLLQRHRCLLKSFANGLHIPGAVTDQNKPLVPLPAATLLVFQLQLLNADFALFTDLTALAPLAAPFYNFTTPNSPPTLASRRMSKKESFTVGQPAAQESFVLTDNPLDGLQSAAFKVQGLGGVNSIVGYDAAKKIITVNTAAAQQGTIFEVSYDKAVPLERGIFAEVEINYAGSGAAIAQPLHFELKFEPQKVFWRYYIVGEPGKKFTIDDTNTPKITFSTRNLNSNPDASDSVAATLAARFPQMQRTRLVSDTLVACQQQGRKSMQLKRDNSKVIDHLPNPSIQNLIMTTSTGANPQPQIALYQVVQHFSQITTNS